MAKKKINFGFTPSKYQEKLFNWVQHGVGNAVIVARAGSGKTTSAVAAMKLIPKRQKCLFIAFNKSIAEELNERLRSYDNVTAKTMHSLGFLMIRRNIGDVEIDEYKYRTHLKSNINELSSLIGMKMSRSEIEQYLNNITTLIDFARFYDAQSTKEIMGIAVKYDVPVAYDECDVVIKCLDWGKHNLTTIDFTDMIWLPVTLDMKPIGLQYDWIFLDEAQDTSIVVIKLFQKCFKRGSRFVAIGDDQQCINLFAGANEESFNYLIGQPHTTTMELPISYRCAKKVIELAQTYVPDIQYREDAPEGEIVRRCKIADIKDGDMVLSRAKSPLLKLYNKLLKRGINCYIKGAEIGKNLIQILEKVDCENLSEDLNEDSVFVRLYDRLFEERNKLMKKYGLDFNDATLSAQIMERYDTIDTLATLAIKVKTKSELIEKIKNIFVEDAKGVCLSTIHKAKGLEAQNVYILCHSTMPSKMAKHEWEKIQERNLVYVAYTRAKEKLGFVSEKEIPPCGSMREPMAVLNELIYIENKVCKVLGKTPTERMDNADIARFQLQNMVEIKDIHENDNVCVLDEIKNTTDKTDEDLINELFN